MTKQKAYALPGTKVSFKTYNGSAFARGMDMHDEGFAYASNPYDIITEVYSWSDWRAGWMWAAHIAEEIK